MSNTNRSAIELGYILKHVPGCEFSMDRFDDRLRLQKTVYLLQAFGINRGCEFGWYLRGPYCPLGATDCFDLRGVYSGMPDGRRVFTAYKANEAFSRFYSFVRGKSTAYLEIAAPMHRLKLSGTGGSDDHIKKKAEQRRPEFMRGQVEQARSDMSEAGLI